MPSQNVRNLFDLTGRVAIVTGAAMGIGKGIAKKLYEAGAFVVITDIDEEAAKKTAKDIDTSSEKVVAFKADAGSVADGESLMTTITQKYSCPDILVNNAGVYSFIPFVDIPEEAFEETLRINTKGTFFYSQSFSRELIKHGNKGKIINIASIDAIHPTGSMAHYDTSKGAVEMMTKAMALELGPHNICVNAIAPGGILTEGVERQFGISLKECESIMPKGPLGRVGIPEDIANVVLFLSSGASDFLTGIMILADGGVLLT